MQRPHPAHLRSLGAWLVALATASAAAGQVPEIYFSPPRNLSQDAALSQVGVVVQDADRAVYVGWQEAGTVFLSRSGDEGGTFTPPRVMIPSDFDFSHEQHSLAGAAPGVLHASMTQFNLITGGAEILYVRTTDGGVTFSAPIMISVNDVFNSYGSSLAVGWGVAVAWGDADLGGGGGGDAIRYSQSLDGGNAFSPPVRLGATGQGFQGCPSVALTGSGTAHIAWVEGPDVDRIVFTRSVDGGATFSAPMTISRQPPLRSWCPRVVVDAAGNITVVWAEGLAFERRLAFARSTDGGASFSSPAVLSDPAPDVYDPWVAVAGDGTVFVAWMAGDLSNGYRCRLTTVSAGGTPSLPVEPTVCGAMSARSPSALHVAWHEVPAGQTYSDVFHSRGEIRPTNVPRSFYTVPPCRLADTRAVEGPALAANSRRTFSVGGRCGIPDDAVAAAINVTVTRPTDMGNLRLYGAGGLVPSASAINFVADRARANNATVPLGSGAAVTVQCDMPPGSTGSTHLVLDVYGYYR